MIARRLEDRVYTRAIVSSNYPTRMSVTSMSTGKKRQTKSEVMEHPSECSYQSFEGKCPLGVDGSEKPKKFVNVKRHMMIRHELVIGEE